MDSSIIIVVRPTNKRKIVKTYIVIGDASAGKSSVVRALSGVRNSDERIMARTGGKKFSLWAKDSSLQEARITPQEYIGEAKLRNTDAVLLTLWPRAVSPRSGNPNRFPNAHGYIQEFLNEGWSIQDVVTLNNPLTLSLPPKLSSTNFNNVHTNPFNVFVASIRANWNWQ